MSTSVGAATDHLYGLAQQSVTGVTVGKQQVVAWDGDPDELTLAMFIVGLSEPPPNAAGDIVVTREWSPIGDRWVDEAYDIPACIDIRVPGKDATQKQARDICEGIFNTFWALIVADVTLGGALAQGHAAEITGLRFAPSSVGTVAEPARRHFASFTVHCPTTVK